MTWSLRWRLSAMMFLQYATLGAWMPVIYPYLYGPLGFSAGHASWVFATMSLACIVTPFVGGQIADRWFPTQYVLSVAYLLGGVFLLLAARQRAFPGMMLYMSLYCLAVAPTYALINSLAFHHLPDTRRHFGQVRVGGTIGWIFAGVVLSAWRSGYLGLPPAPDRGDCLILSAVFSLIMGAFCLLLPHTPPRKEAQNPWAFLGALRLCRKKDVAVFLGISFLVTTQLQFYYMPTAQFLQDCGISEAAAPATMTISQVSEIVTMGFLLPLLLTRLGIRRSLAIGVLAYMGRYVFFAVGWPLWLVVGSLAFHGIALVFFFTVGQIYVNQVAPRDIRASAQSLLTLITGGLGSLLGIKFTGEVLDFFTAAGRTHWGPVFAVPSVATLLCGIGFLLLFRGEEKKGQAIP